MYSPSQVEITCRNWFLAQVMLLHQDLANRACVPFVPFLLLGLQAAGQCRRRDQPGVQQRLPKWRALPMAGCGVESSIHKASVLCGWMH